MKSIKGSISTLFTITCSLYNWKYMQMFFFCLFPLPPNNQRSSLVLVECLVHYIHDHIHEKKHRGCKNEEGSTMEKIICEVLINGEFFKYGHEILVKENLVVCMSEVWHKENNILSPQWGVNP